LREKRIKRQPPEGARKAAWSILLEWESGDKALESIRDKLFTRIEPPPREKALITELTQGVVRNRLYLEHNIRSHLDKSDSSLPIPVWQALFLGAYQLLLLDRIPNHAAVMETVEILKGTRYRGFSPLVNAVLRKIAEMGPGPVPDPAKDPLKHIGLTTSNPDWLVENLASQIGIPTTREILQALNRTPPLTLRTNTLVTDRRGLLEELKSAGIDASPGLLSDTAVILRDRLSPRELIPLLEGRCVIQDEGAQMIAPLLSVCPGQKILDMCAAPGGKTGHLAQLVKNRAFLVAVDRNPLRFRMMVEAFEKPGFICIRHLMADMAPAGSPLLPEVFDRILLDAPCSGTGVLRRHPEGKWKKNMNTIRNLISEQQALLDTAACLLRTGGLLLYTTCSILREENEDLLDRYLSGPVNLKRLNLKELHPKLPSDMFNSRGDLRLWPHVHNCDGFFACLMEKQ
jgi:16S rRNA (cytosine967-C5)-methyltransferase